MKKILPKIFLILIVFVFSSAFFFSFVHSSFAATAPTPTETPTPTIVPTAAGTTPAPTGFVEDQEVTFVGKNAARAGLLLDWALSAQNSGWIYLQPNSSGTGTTPNPLYDFWWTIATRVVAPILVLFVLIGAFVLIATRGRNLTIRKFIIRFVLVVLLWYFSWSIIQFIYQLADIVQLFFLKSPTYSTATTVVDISQKDLLSVGWDYATFIGLRAADLHDTESAFVALLLVKLTAVTYYVMVGILLLRKIIMWFFIILSPVFPLLLFFGPIRNTAKIWVGEFLRWVLYAPLFAILLAGLVHVWTIYIPMDFTNYTPSNNAHVPADVTSGNTAPSDHFATAINILLGAPNQQVGLNNSVNYTETFAEYVVALLMLWVVILLPFILLQIFLDYVNTITINDNAWVQQLLARTSFRSSPPPVSSPSPPPGKIQPAGLAKSIPFSTGFKMPQQFNKKLQTSQQLPELSHPAQLHTPQKVDAELLQLTNLSVPTMRDIAQYETRVISSKPSSPEVTRVEETLQHIANPSSAAGSQEEAYTQIRSKLMTESQRGNILAKNILQAAGTVEGISVSPQGGAAVAHVMSTMLNPAQAVTAIERAKVNELRQVVVQASEKGNPTASRVVSSMNSINKAEIENIQKLLQNLANPDAIADVSQQMLFRELKEDLQDASRQGDEFATSLLSEVKSIPANKPDILLAMKVREQIQQASKKGSVLANRLLAAASSENILGQVQILLKSLEEAKEKGDPIAQKVLELFGQSNGVSEVVAGLPMSNRVQTVSIEDYEAVRNMWTENYEKMDVPQRADGNSMNRVSWLQSDVNTINETIALLSSHDQQKVAQGMQHVSGILPFLLIGGFSQTEIIAYLSAKLQAAKEVLARLGKKEEEEDTQLTAKKATASQQQQTMAAEVPEENKRT